MFDFSELKGKFASGRDYDSFKGVAGRIVGFSMKDDDVLVWLVVNEGVDKGKLKRVDIVNLEVAFP